MHSFGITDKGCIREANEDAFFISNEPIGQFPNLYIVADGMGGHNAGEVASNMAISEFTEYIRQYNDQVLPLEEIFIKAIHYTNNKIYLKSSHENHLYGMGSTFVVCTIVDENMIVGNIGDSRLYILDDTFHQVTIDHSYVEELVRAGEITRDESRVHPEKNKITRAVGVVENITMDLFKISCEKINKVLLCSDGLTNMIDDKQLEDILKSQQVIEEQGNKLIDEAIESGGNDNITLIIIDMTKEK